MKGMKRILVSLVLALALTLIGVSPALAATSDTVTVNATPVFISMTVTEASWTVNAGGDSKTRKNTTYYWTDANNGTSPSGVIDGTECGGSLVNTSNVATDITITCTNFTGGDAWTNSGTTTNGANAYSMVSWFVGDTYTAWGTGPVVVKASAPNVAKNALGATTSIEFGIGILTPTADPASGTAQSATLTVTAAEDA
jgi:hypothetical protein